MKNGTQPRRLQLGWLIVCPSCAFLVLIAASGHPLVLLVNVAIVVWTVHALSNRTFTLRELATLHTGFLFNCLLISPTIFYARVGDPPQPRPYANEVMEATQYVFLALILWLIIATFLMRRKWPMAVAFGLYQAWFGLLSVFVNAGAVQGAFL